MIPIRDTTIETDKRSFDELGIFDVIGYVDFQNSHTLATEIGKKIDSAVPHPVTLKDLNRASPLYHVKCPIDTDGALRIATTLKKSTVYYRELDIIETPRVSLNEILRNVSSSLAVVSHLLDPHRKGALVHNARSALIAGIALAQQKWVTLIQEGSTVQPIDFRDIVVPYSQASEIERILAPLIKHVHSGVQTELLRAIAPPKGLLNQIDLGAVSAENEIRNLKFYFVPTSQFSEVKRGSSRIVVGRKGTGKTAIFYAVRDSLGNRQKNVVLDLKPEGHQMIRLKEGVLQNLTEGTREHTLVAFWNYILLCEIAHSITSSPAEETRAMRSRDTHDAFEQLSNAYKVFSPKEDIDFSERLKLKVEEINGRFGSRVNFDSSKITEYLYSNEIRNLDRAVANYLESKDGVWVLIDNLDKAWPTRGADDIDISILRSLLEATRKLQKQLEKRNVEFHVVVFIRTDIYEHLLSETADRGKDHGVFLDYDDPDLFKRIILERIRASARVDGEFDEIWAAVFDNHIGTVNSFSYMLDRSLNRPRELLNFIRTAIEVAVNRGHTRVQADDILHAEVRFSNEVLKATSFEIRDVFPRLEDPLYAFIGCASHLTRDEIAKLFEQEGVPASRHEELIDVLFWFGFLGVFDRNEASHYCYSEQNNLSKLVARSKKDGALYVINPAFRTALGCIQLI